MANWHATRSRHYRSPLVKGTRRGSATKRDRILNDDELRAVWQQAEANGTYGALVRMALLTAQRQDKLATLKWSDLEANVWTIATLPREKGNAGLLELPEQAMAIINAQSRNGSYVFAAARSDKPISGWSKLKRAFDAKVKIAPWAFHDLRRTAKSLMARAGVRPDISERVMGHAIPGVEGVYDRYQYKEEKAHALRAIVGIIENITQSPSSKVRRLRGLMAPRRTT
jgi:integrase